MDHKYSKKIADRDVDLPAVAKRCLLRLVTFPDFTGRMRTRRLERQRRHRAPWHCN